MNNLFYGILITIIGVFAFRYALKRKLSEESFVAYFQIYIGSIGILISGLIILVIEIIKFFS